MRAAFTIAAESELIAVTPHFPRGLPPAKPRQGFFEHHEYVAIRSFMTRRYQDIVDFAYLTGWRRGEILGLTWEEVNIPARRIRLDPARSKNGDTRVLPLVGPLLDLLRSLNDRKTLGSPWVFANKWGGRIGISSFDKEWQRAREKAGLPHRLFHDTRRTVARRLVMAGVPEHIAMLVTGHRTSDVFRRYAITRESDIEAALEASFGRTK